MLESDSNHSAFHQSTQRHRAAGSKACEKGGGGLEPTWRLPSPNVWIRFKSSCIPQSTQCYMVVRSKAFEEERGGSELSVEPSIEARTSLQTIGKWKKANWEIPQLFLKDLCKWPTGRPPSCSSRTSASGQLGDPTCSLRISASGQLGDPSCSSRTSKRVWLGDPGCSSRTSKSGQLGDPSWSSRTSASVSGRHWLLTLTPGECLHLTDTPLEMKTPWCSRQWKRQPAESLSPRQTGQP